MIEQVYHLTQGNTKTIEKILQDEEIHYMHMILNKGEGLPEHFSNAKSVYMTVVRGHLSIGLDAQESHDYPAGTMLKIPFHTWMQVRNLHDEPLELIVVKAPAPQNPK